MVLRISISNAATHWLNQIYRRRSSPPFRRSPRQSSLFNQTMEPLFLGADPYGRNMYGVPPQGRADYAFFQHIIASMNPHSGRCAILFPHGVLFRDERTNNANQTVRGRYIGVRAGTWGQISSTTHQWRHVWSYVVCISRKHDAKGAFN